MSERKLAATLSDRKAAALKKAAADPKFNPKDGAILTRAAAKQAALMEYWNKLVAAERSR